MLLAVFILCCTGAADGVCRTLRIRKGGVAALSLLCAALSAFSLTVVRGVSVQPACALLAALGLLFCLRRPETALTVPLAFLCGIFGWLLQRTFPAFFDAALLAALPAALLGRILPIPARQGLLCTLLAPLFFGVVAAIEHWYLFDVFTIFIGDAMQLDMQMCGAFAFGLLCAIRVNKLKKCEVGQKEY